MKRIRVTNIAESNIPEGTIVHMYETKEDILELYEGYPEFGHRQITDLAYVEPEYPLVKNMYPKDSLTTAVVGSDSYEVLEDITPTASRGYVCWEDELLPEPQDIGSTCNTYYVVKVDKCHTPIAAMYLINEDGEAGWYTNYITKLIGEVIGWAKM